MTDRPRDPLDGVLRELSRPVEVPDLTASILREVGRQRPFVPPRSRLWMKRARLAAGVALVVGLSGIALVQRLAPDSTVWAGRPAPLTDLLDEKFAPAGERVRQIQSVATMNSSEFLRSWSTSAPGVEDEPAAPELPMLALTPPRGTEPEPLRQARTVAYEGAGYALDAASWSGDRLPAPAVGVFVQTPRLVLRVGPAEPMLPVRRTPAPSLPWSEPFGDAFQPR